MTVVLNTLPNTASLLLNSNDAPNDAPNDNAFADLLAGILADANAQVTAEVSGAINAPVLPLQVTNTDTTALSAANTADYTNTTPNISDAAPEQGLPSGVHTVLVDMAPDALVAETKVMTPQSPLPATSSMAPAAWHMAVPANDSTPVADTRPVAQAPEVITPPQTVQAPEVIAPQQTAQPTPNDSATNTLPCPAHSRKSKFTDDAPAVDPTTTVIAPTVAAPVIAPVVAPVVINTPTPVATEQTAVSTQPAQVLAYAAAVQPQVATTPHTADVLAATLPDTDTSTEFSLNTASAAVAPRTSHANTLPNVPQQPVANNTQTALPQGTAFVTPYAAAPVSSIEPEVEPVVIKAPLKTVIKDDSTDANTFFAPHVTANSTDNNVSLTPSAVTERQVKLPDNVTLKLRREDDDTISVDLEPAGLGRVTLLLREDHKGVTATLRADNATVPEMFRRELPALERHLRDMGVPLGRDGVQFEHGGGQQQQQQQQQRALWQKPDDVNSSSESPMPQEVIAPTPTQSRASNKRSNGLDVRL